MAKREDFELNQGVSGGRYSALKIFHHPEKLAALLRGEVTSPIYVRVKPTNECNHGCFYCVYDPEFSGIHPLSDRTDELPKGKMEEILGDFGEMGVKAVTYSGGGEPLAYPHIVETLKRTLEMGIGLSMITNGQNLGGEPAELLTKADWVRVSLDCSNPKMFAQIRRRPESWFTQLVENLDSFGRRKGPDCDFGVNCVVNRLNYEGLVDIARLCKDVGVANLRFAPLWRKNFTEYHEPFKTQAMEQIELARKLQEDGTFSVGSTYDLYFNGTTGDDQRNFDRCFYMQIVPVVAADQNVYTCHNNAYEPSGRVGSIREMSFRDMWFSPETAEFFKRFDPGQVCNHECSNERKNLILNEFARCGGEDVVDYV